MAESSMLENSSLLKDFKKVIPKIIIHKNIKLVILVNNFVNETSSSSVEIFASLNVFSLGRIPKNLNKS